MRIGMLGTGDVGQPLGDARVKTRARRIGAAITMIAALAVAGPASADLPAADAAYATLLAKYVTPAGVRYGAWRADGQDVKTLSEIVTVFRATDTAPLSPAAREALYINLYNSRVLEIVLEAHPAVSIRDLSRHFNPNEIFSRNTINFAGKTISLNDLEKRLRDEFKDPRVHFAINCASRSCPPIRSEPYAADVLDMQLDDAARGFLASPGAVVLETRGGKITLTVSKIFDWYADDFKSAGGVAAFIGKYAPKGVSDAIAAAGDKIKLDYADYDWSLNGVKGSGLSLTHS
jgi:Protein of unknown function, DUF547